MKVRVIVVKLSQVVFGFRRTHVWGERGSTMRRLGSIPLRLNDTKIVEMGDGGKRGSGEEAYYSEHNNGDTVSFQRSLLSPSLRGGFGGRVCRHVEQQTWFTELSSRKDGKKKGKYGYEDATF